MWSVFESSVENLARVKGVLGDHNRILDEAGERSIEPIKMQTHPDFNRRTLENDICLIEIAPVDLGLYFTAQNQ